MRPNIYPRTLENIKAVLLFYFPKISHGEINASAEKVYDQRKFKLNELEYCCEVLSKNESLIREYYKSLDLNILLVVGYSVLFEDEKRWGSTSRREKLKSIKAGLVI
ncbi:hypothetical protein Q2T41_16935 [Maribacter confluentis]|uniref:Uncharacterized protein n=1 Tax=Maribacter confluentis TaxID=1656093 RepID=A0ABT8RTT0_9FLAO|nr:hypothetical protein [Maribacter confluentis]MDO1514342.1 hypothetical protein [Maribacter confluentis]